LPARPVCTIAVCALLLTCAWVLPRDAEGGRVRLSAFSDGFDHASVVFPSAGTNSSVSIRLPKAAIPTRATLEVSGSPFLENWSIAADTREDFSAFRMSNLDINTSPGEVVLEKEYFATDEFGNSSLDSRWSWLNSPSSWDLGVSRPGWLHMVSRRNTNFNGSRDDGALVYQTVSGNFTLETKINCTPQWDYQKAGIMVRQDQNNWVALKYQNQSGKKVQWSVKSNGNMWNDVSSGGQSASEMWLRLMREGSRWVSFYSTNGQSWTQLWDTNQGTAKTLNDPVRIGLLIADGGTWTYWPADYDYLNFSRYAAAGSMTSRAISTSVPVTQARATWNGPTSPINANFVLFARTSAASPWERLILNSTTALSYTGTQPQFMFQMTSNGIRTPDLFDIEVNFSALLYPAGLSAALGARAPFWSHPGELRTLETVDLAQELAAYLAAATPDPEGNVTVPLSLSCGSKGVAELGNLSIEYIIGAAPPAPVLVAPGQGTFVTTLTPELRLSCTDPDNDPVFFCVEVSGDGFLSRTEYNQTTSTMGWSRLGTPYQPGEEALLTLSVPLLQGRTYAWRASAYDGAYWGPLSAQREFTVDATPPEGSVSLPGRFTGDPSTAGALFSFRDNESGVARYEYSIGTRPGTENILPAVTTENATVQVVGLALQTGANYYFTVRAQNRAGLWSAESYSDAFQYWPASVAPVGVTIDRPAPGSEVSGVVQVTGTAWIRDGWTRENAVQYRADQDLWRFIPASGLNQTRQWSVEWDTRLFADGPHRVEVRLVQGLINSTELASARACATVRNSVGPPPLTASFHPTPGAPLSVEENSRLEFNLTTDAQNLSIQWSVDGQPRQGETFTRFEFRPGFTMAGLHNVSVTVRSGDQELWHEWNVTVVNVDRPPAAGISTPPPGTRWTPGENITFNASSSSDPDPDDTLRFLWNMGDGTQLEGLEVVHAYARAGNYTVTLTVTDGTLQATARVELTVAEPTRDITTGGGNDLTLILALAGLALAVTAVFAGGYVHARRRRAAREAAAKGPASQRLYRLPPPSLVDDEEEVPRLREVAGTDWKRLEREAARTHAVFTPPARPGTRYSNSAPAAQPGEPSPPSIPPPQPTIQPPEDASFEDIPEVEAMPEEHIPEAPATVYREPGAGSRVPGYDRVPEAGHDGLVPRYPEPGPPHPDSSRPPAPGTRHPVQKPDPMDELLALLEKHR